MLTFTHRLRRRLQAEDGFTLLPTMALIIALMLLSAAALAQAGGDAKPAAKDRDRKQALAAAQAGVQDYLARLRQNPSYWTLCTGPASLPATDPGRNPALNNPNPTAAARGWAPVGDGVARYSIELLPAPNSGHQTCSTAKSTDSMIDIDTGAFRIRVTGQPRVGSRVRRSLVATFRPRGFLNYIYFTDYETMDPAWYKREAYGQTTREDPRPPAANGAPQPQRNIVQWATDECTRYWFQSRGTQRFTGTATNDGASGNGLLWTDGKWYTTPRPGGNNGDPAAGLGDCGEIQFVTGDRILGPMHTNDSINVCGTPQFGETAADTIEMRGGGEGWRSACSGSAPNKVGAWNAEAPFVQIPESNTQLYNDANENYRFMGTTYLTFSDTGKVTVKGRKLDGTMLNDVQLDMPTNGVIYVSNDTDPARPCAVEYDPIKPDSAPVGCGNAIIEGTYSRSITIGAERDIVIANNFRRKDDSAMGGLIANGFVRVKHTINDWSATTPCQEQGPQLNDVYIDAAILSLNHSFTVDGYYCGVKRGTLHVDGAIAQKYRGPVGTGGDSSIGTGYLKGYKYDKRLRYRSPPRFMNPAGAQWTLLNTVEQVPSA